MSDKDFSEHLAPNLYFDRNFNIEAAKILPGEYYVTARNMLIVTVLGSCVSVCLRDRESGIGGMNHFMLPGSTEGEVEPASMSARYGIYAMEILINHLLKLGALRKRFEAKVFGGGQVLEGMRMTPIGKQNVEFVLRFLQTENIPILAQDLLDIYPRKVYFFPRTGRVLVRKMKELHNNTIATRELEYSRQIANSKVQGDIELFT